MNILINPYEFSRSNIFFLDIKDNIIMNGKFIKFNYSTELITINGLYLEFPINGFEQNIYNGRQYLFFLKEFHEENEKLIHQYKQKAKLHISSNFNQDVVWKNLLNEYKNLIAENGL